MDKTIFGKPNLAFCFCSEAKIVPLSVDHLESADVSLQENGHAWHKDPEKYELEFEVPEINKDLYKLFGLVKKKRFPRKMKKSIKKIISKVYGIRVKKIIFSNK